MRQEGYVTAVLGNKAKIRVDRESACGGNCVSCKGCPAEATVVECEITQDIQVGDRVELTMSDVRFLGGVALGYGILTLLAVCGAVLGFMIEKSEGASFVGLVTGIVLGIIVLRIAFSTRRIEITARKID